MAFTTQIDQAGPAYISQGQSGRICRRRPPCLLCTATLCLYDKVVSTLPDGGVGASLEYRGLTPLWAKQCQGTALQRGLNVDMLHTFERRRDFRLTPLYGPRTKSVESVFVSNRKDAPLPEEPFLFLCLWIYRGAAG